MLQQFSVKNGRDGLAKKPSEGATILTELTSNPSFSHLVILREGRNCGGVFLSPKEGTISQIMVELELFLCLDVWKDRLVSEEETTVAEVARDHLGGHADVGDVCNGATLRPHIDVVRHVAGHHFE